MKRCRHDDFEMITHGTGLVRSCIGLLCKSCGAVRNSVNVGAKWERGDKLKMIAELVIYFGVDPSTVKLDEQQPEPKA